MRILLAYNQPVYIQGLIELISKVTKNSIIDNVDTPEKIISAFKKRYYEIVIIDAEELNLLDIVFFQKLYHKIPLSKIIINSHTVSQDLIDQLELLNISYFPKNAELTDIIAYMKRAINKVN